MTPSPPDPSAYQHLLQSILEPRARDATTLEQAQIPIQFFRSDVSHEFVDWASEAGIIAWDIETTGLDWRTERIATCQLYVPRRAVAIVRVTQAPPRELLSILANASILKLFHNAVFDLRFMAYQWKANSSHIACTRVASRLLDRQDRAPHNLQVLLRHYLGVVIDKNQQKSDWLSPRLTKEQVLYAIRDVLYLPELLSVIEQQLQSRNLLDLARRCFAHIPTRVQLDILDYGDVYAYK